MLKNEEDQKDQKKRTLSGVIKDKKKRFINLL